MRQSMEIEVESTLPESAATVRTTDFGGFDLHAPGWRVRSSWLRPRNSAMSSLSRVTAAS